MEYAQELRKAERFLHQNESTFAVQVCGRILESALRQLFKELLPKLPPEELTKATQALEAQGKGKTVDELTLGQLVGLYREARLVKMAKERLGRDLSILENIQLVQDWVNLRNRAAHGEDVDAGDARNFVENLRTLLQRAKLVSEFKPRKGELPSWWEVVRPHPDVLGGKLDPAKFAAKLDDVVGGRADAEYQDPAEFARRTWPTKGLLNLLRTAQSRLSGQGGEAVVHLQTTFGGGKTHALITLYHFVRAPDVILQEFGLDPQTFGLAQMGKAQVAAFVGAAADPLKGRTPWGEIAAQLGKYELVREHDEQRVSPGKDLLRKLLGEEPVLILIDEIAEYLTKLALPGELARGEHEAARAYQSQVFTFLHELTELASGLPRCLVVVTTTTSSPYGEEGERVQEKLADIVGRTHRLAEPVHGTEIYEVVRQRLFADIGDPSLHRQVAERFFAMYRELGAQAPEEVQTPEYRQRLERAYPFHPELIDLLYNQWGSFHEFQRTRGVLRFLAEIVAWQWKQRKNLPALPVIRACDVPLEVPSVRESLLQPLERAYDSVMANDIVGGRGLAREVDTRLLEEMGKERLAEGLATAIFLYSFSGAQKEERGVNLARLRVAALRPGLSPAAVGDIVQQLEEKLLYLHKHNGRYFFSTELNLNRAVLSAEEGVEEQRILEEIQTLLEKKLGQEFPVSRPLWPDAPGQVPDRREHVLVVLGPSHSFGGKETNEFVETLFKYAGGTPRAAPGALLVLAADADELRALRTTVRNLLALREVQKRDADQLGPEDVEELKKRIKQREVQVSDGTMKTWCHLALWRGSDPAEWQVLEPSPQSGQTISGLVLAHLKKQDRFTDKLSPDELLRRCFASEETAKPYRELWSLFLSVPGMPIVRERTVREAICEGVRSGVLGVQVDAEVLWKREVAHAVLEPETVILTGEEARRRSPAAPPEREKEPLGPAVIGREKEKPAELLPKRKTRYRLRVRVPWEKVSDFQRGVVVPLKGVCERVELEITVEAEASQGIPDDVLRHKVQETLRQSNFSVLEERVD